MRRHGCRRLAAALLRSPGQASESFRVVLHSSLRQLSPQTCGPSSFASIRQQPRPGLNRLALPTCLWAGYIRLARLHCDLPQSPGSESDGGSRSPAWQWPGPVSFVRVSPGPPARPAFTDSSLRREAGSLQVNSPRPLAAGRGQPSLASPGPRLGSPVSSGPRSRPGFKRLTQAAAAGLHSSPGQRPGFQVSPLRLARAAQLPSLTLPGHGEQRSGFFRLAGPWPIITRLQAQSIGPRQLFDRAAARLYLPPSRPGLGSHSPCMTVTCLRVAQAATLSGSVQASLPSPGQASLQVASPGPT